MLQFKTTNAGTPNSKELLLSKYLRLRSATIALRGNRPLLLIFDIGYVDFIAFIET